MLIEHQSPYNKSIMVAVLGRPNAGKSTLINTFLGFDLSIVSHRPQTTRNFFHCALTIDHTEIILLDTPGVHKSSKELNVRMNGQAQMAHDGVDLNLLLIDGAAKELSTEYELFKKNFDVPLKKTWIVFTKSDLNKNTAEDYEAAFKKLQECNDQIERYFVLSSKTEHNIYLLTGAICDIAPEGPHLYPNGDVSNKNQRFFATEYIREQAFKVLKDEIPYEMAVVIEDFQDPTREQEKKASLISATIIVNRPSQRAIVVGRSGSVIKEIGTQSRKKIEALIGNKVNLNLHVKVMPKWFNNNYVLDEIGLPRTQKSKRVWRKR